VFAKSADEGRRRRFFYLGPYVERNLQYGLVHADLTPRPAYVASASWDDFSMEPSPSARDFGDEKLMGYVSSDHRRG